MKHFMSKNRKIKKAKKTRALKNLPKREVISIHQFSKIAMSFWIGGSCMVALVIFPLLFKVLDQITASHIVGQSLSMIAYIGVVCLFISLIEVIINHKFALLKTKRFWYILSMAFIVIINYFAIFPLLSKLRAQLSSAAHQVIAVQSNSFDFWHSLSSLLFILTCVIGVLYLIEM